MHPSIHALRAPDRPAYIMVESGEVVTYRQLDERSNQAAQLFRRRGLARGDRIAILMENHPRFLELCWGAQRSGLYYTPLGARLTAAEVGYILGDLEAKLLFVSPGRAAIAAELVAQGFPSANIMVVDKAPPGLATYDVERDRMPRAPVADESCGIDLLYSSGTTGRPKGVRLPLPEGPITTLAPRWQLYHTWLGFDVDSVHYVPSPLYHALPLHHAMVAQNYGGTVLVVPRFDAETALDLIQRHRVTHSSWVATMFVRLLKIPPETRARYDVSSLKVAMHGAGPCPIPVKLQMIEWFGPILEEVYGMTEGYGSTAISSKDWLLHKGSVGRSLLGPVHIVDEVTGQEMPAYGVGTIFFENPREVEYLNDPGKTASVRTPAGWATAGDIGYLDAEGFLFLTDRKADVIISGGVNVYPQEAENLLLTHGKVQDAAVFGIPHEDLGETVQAVVQPMPGVSTGPELERELIAFCRGQLAPLKVPRSIDFSATLPRDDTGKLYKRLLKEKYRQKPSPDA